MALGKQAKILTAKQERVVLKHLLDTRYPIRNTVMFFLSHKSGLRAKEVSSLTWSMVTDANGSVGDYIALEDKAAKGAKGGRTIPLNAALKSALIQLQTDRGVNATPESCVINSERGKGLSANAVAVWFHRLYNDLGFEGCSSHSGRRSFVSKAAHNIFAAGGSLRDVQQLAGHSSLATTQRYIEGNSEAKKKVVDLI